MTDDQETDEPRLNDTRERRKTTARTTSKLNYKYVRTPTIGRYLCGDRRRVPNLLTQKLRGTVSQGAAGASHADPRNLPTRLSAKKFATATKYFARTMTTRERSFQRGRREQSKGELGKACIC